MGQTTLKKQNPEADHAVGRRLGPRPGCCVNVPEPQGPGLRDLQASRREWNRDGCYRILDSWSKHFPESTYAEERELEAGRGKLPPLETPSSHSQLPSDEGSRTAWEGHASLVSFRIAGPQLIPGSLEGSPHSCTLSPLSSWP